MRCEISLPHHALQAQVAPFIVVRVHAHSGHLAIAEADENGFAARVEEERRFLKRNE